MISHFSESANGLTGRGRKRKPKKGEKDEIDGFAEQAAMAKRARRNFDSSQYAGLPDRRFMKMDGESLQRHLRVFDTDPLVRIATNINLNAALGGSILITDESDTDSDLEEKQDQKTKDLNEWRSYTYSGFLGLPIATALRLVSFRGRTCRTLWTRASRAF